MVSELGFEAAGADQAPARDGLKNGEQPRHDKNQPDPPFHVARHNNARDEAQRANDTARHAPAMAEIGLEKAIHARNLARRVPKEQARCKEDWLAAASCAIIPDYELA